MSDTPVSTTPYFLRALYEWCVDSGLTPYMTVRVDQNTRVPPGYVKDGQIVLSLGPNAIRGLHMDNDAVSFSARFGGVAHELYVPVANVLAIYAQETGEGMAFGVQTSAAASVDAVGDSGSAGTEEPAPGHEGPERPKGRPSLRLVK